MAQYWHQPAGRSVVVAAADPNPRSLQWFKDNVHGEAFFTDDYRRLLDRKDVHAVAVCSPDAFHEEHAVATLAAGKHLFCEKPLGITVAEADNILRAAKAAAARGVRAMVGFNMRYMAKIRTMKEIVDSGVLGVVKALWTRHFINYGGAAYFHDWHATRKAQNSLLIQKATHDLDVMHWIVGAYTRKVVAVGGLLWYGGEEPNDLTCPACGRRATCTDPSTLPVAQHKCAFRREIDVEDLSMVLMHMDRGILGSYQQCHFAPDNWRNYCVIGTEGRLEANRDETIDVFTRRSNSYREYADRRYSIKPAEGTHDGADPQISDAFVRLCLDGEPSVCPLLAGRMSVAAGATATESLRNGSALLDVPALPADLADVGET
jgi:predicted dehydrogenase